MSNNDIHTTGSTALFDLTLNPSNAVSKGYDYIDDVIYDQSNPSEAMLEIVNFCKQFSCRLGNPTQRDRSKQFFGLYLPKENVI